MIVLKKQDLKDNMIVRLRDGELFMVLKNKLIGKRGWDSLIYYNEDLTHSFDYEDLDISKIYNIKIGEVYVIKDIFDISNLELIHDFDRDIKTINFEEYINKQVLVSNDNLNWTIAKLLFVSDSYYYALVQENNEDKNICPFSVVGFKYCELMGDFDGAL